MTAASIDPRIDRARALLGSPESVLKRRGLAAPAQCPSCGARALQTEGNEWYCEGCWAGGDALELERLLAGEEFDVMLARLVPSPNGVERPEPRMAEVRPIREARPRKGQVPPHNLEAEESVLGAMMIDANARTDCLALLTPTDFYRDVHTKIYEAIQATDPCDAILVADELAGRGQLEAIGGKPYLHTLVNAVPFTANATYYARIVTDDARARRALDALTTATQQLYDGADADQATQALQESLEPPVVVAIGPDPDVYAMLEEPDDYDWLVEGLLERTDRLILTGLEGHGKSTLLRQIGVQIASGIHPFTNVEIAPARVLLVDLENSRNQIKRKLRSLVLAAGKRLEHGMMVPCARNGLDLLDREDVAWLQGRIVANRPDLLLIGPLYKMHEGETNPEEDPREVARIIDDLRARFGLTVIIEAHVPHKTAGAAQPHRPYGASLWKRWPEFGLFLSESGTLTHWRGPRDERAWPNALRRGGLWPWTPAKDDGGGADQIAGPAEEMMIVKIEAAIREHLDLGGKGTVRACLEAVRSKGLKFSDAFFAPIHQRVVAERLEESF